MPITKQRDPRTKKEITFVEGKVEKIYVNPVKEIKTYAGPNGPWTPTHIINFVVDGIRIGLGLTDKTEVRGKTEDDKYHDVTEGSTVTVEISKIGEYKGKPTYETKPSLIFINDLAPASAAPARGAGNTEGRDKEENPGMLRNHANNAAGYFMAARGMAYKFETYNEIAEAMHRITTELKAEYTKTNPFGFSRYEIGNAAGGAVLNAAKLATKIENVKALAADLLEKNVPYMQAVVTGKVGGVNEDVIPAPTTPEPATGDNSDYDEDLPF